MKDVYIFEYLFRMIAEVMKMREEEKKQSSQKFFKKRWVFPAIYLASAAIIITGILWYQSAGNDVADDSEDFGFEENATDKQFDNPAVEVNRSLENFVMPVKNPENAVIEKQFYDENASAEEQEAALVVYNNQYQPNQGIDISNEGKDFNVLAAMSGKVTKVQDDALLGNIIEIEHAEGIVTRYQSVKDFNVAVGDSVEQGQEIAKAGTSQLNEKAGTHVHFEIRKDNVAVNPLEYMNKSLASLKEANVEDEKKLDEGTASEKAEDPAAEGETSSTPEASEEEAAEQGEGQDEAAEEQPAEDKATDEQSSTESEADQENPTSGEEPKEQKEQE
jgi:stage II sporulation protein Q